MIFKSLTTRVIFISILLLALGISAFAFLNLRREREQLHRSARESTEVLIHTIERSIYNSMRIGNTEDVQLILQMVGQNHKLHAVRIFHPQGIVLKSANPDEVGRPVNAGDYKLFLSNKQDGIVDVPGDDEVLSMIKPIYNEGPCHFCHGHRTRVIGVLNVNYSLAETKRRILEATNLFIFSTIVIIIFLSAAISLVMLKFVKKPLDRIVDNMAKVEQGDLSVRMQPEGKDEIGRLIASFDSMVDRLDLAKRELEKCHYQQMERADRLASLGEMAAGIAHEIKNPLTGIATAVSIIKDEFADEDPRKAIAKEVLDQINRLDKTANDLLFFGKPTQPELVYTDVNEILRKTLMFALQHKSSKKVETRFEEQTSLPFVYVDQKQIQQVFFNLILNAVQAMHDGGVLTVKAEAGTKGDKECVLIKISDTGPGIPPHNLEKIFTPFFTTKAQGTGLGLAICHKLVTQLRGCLAVESEVGKGTEFTITLPAYSLEEVPEAYRDGAKG